MRCAVWLNRGLRILGVGLAMLGLAAGWIVWQFGPAVRALPARVRANVAAHHGVWVSAPQVSPWFRQALIATEDRSFATNWGVSFVGLGRALWVNLRAGHFRQGGSTLTQQLVSNVLLGSTPTPAQRVLGMGIAVQVTASYTKAEILTFYMNEVYLGQGAYGVGAAAERYFGVSAARLSLPEAALLAGLPQAPSAYDPLVHFAVAKRRQWIVLENLVAVHAITAPQARAAYAAPLPLQRGRLNG